jgi:hypothetical protein
MTNQSKDKKHLQTTWEKEWKKAEGGRNKKKARTSFQVRKQFLSEVEGQK